ncbi:MAG TPA: HEAT repeat domain-containing protein [Kamptonema sp.]|nr:HEAT repeat domain-containing protein [Kamptonema sp.]
MSDVLEQAQAAAEQGNWSLLAQYLQQLGNSDKKLGISASNSQQVLTLSLDVLASGDFQDRWEIAKILPNLGTIAIAPLIAIVEDEDADLEQRWFAVRILGNFDRPEAIAALVELLKTSDSEDLSSIAADTLANLGPSAIASLTNLLVHEESRQFATSALAQIRQPETIEPLVSVAGDPLASVRLAAIEGLSSFHDSRISSVLVEALKDPAVAVRKEAAIALGLRSYLDGEFDLVNLLKPLLKDIRLEVCLAAAIALGRIKTDAAAAALFELFPSPNTPVSLQIEAVRALGWMETKTALDYLQKALSEYSDFQEKSANKNYELEITSHPSPLIKEIITILGRVENPNLKPQAADILINLLQSGHPAIVGEVKQSLALGLGQLGDKKAIEPLIEMLADSDDSVRLHGIAALKQLAPQQAYQKLENLAKENNLRQNLKQGIGIALQEW